MKHAINNIFICFGLIVAFSCETDEIVNPLPILGERDVEYVIIDGKEIADTLYHVVPEFEYLNQDSLLIRSKDIKEKVWVADFFFTNCPSICPPMTSNMDALAQATIDLSDHVQFLSFSIDPMRDTPSNLRRYIERRDIKATNWHFMTGDEDATHLLAKSFFNGAERNSEADGGFGHTEYFALVDKEGHVRGIYQGTSIEQMDVLDNDIRKLLKDEYGIDGVK